MGYVTASTIKAPSVSPIVIGKVDNTTPWLSQDDIIDYDAAHEMYGGVMVIRLSREYGTRGTKSKGVRYLGVPNL